VAKLELDRIWKRFGAQTAVADLSLTVDNGEFVALLGPSGCGKTTSLRMVAGLERPSEGVIRLDGQVINDTPPGTRNVAMVFQSYALYPHMSVYRNLAFGPNIRHEDKEATHRKVVEAANSLGLGKLLDRRPAELSGGQRQRVALARALLRHPKLFLMDEPLSNLDAALREEVRAEIVRIHRHLGTATLYVTHDQVEAMSMADRIAIMFDARLSQFGTPEEIFDKPANLAVATFIGSPRMNLMEGVLLARGERLALQLFDNEIPLPGGLQIRTELPKNVTVGIRPTDVEVRPAGDPGGGASIPGVVDMIEPLGSETLITVKCRDATLRSRRPGRTSLRLADPVSLGVNREFLYIFDAVSGATLVDRNVEDGRQPARYPRTANG
jgi:multiple sugar transport system ATP-binding protein